MIETLIVHALLVYAVFHVVTRSDLPFIRAPRAWVRKTLPGWLTFPLSCSFCFTFWTAIVTSILVFLSSGWLIIDLAYYLVPPVVNLIVDLVVRALIRVNEPPLIAVLPETPRGPVVWAADTAAAKGDWTAVYAAPSLSAYKPEPAVNYTGRRAKIVRGLYGQAGKTGRILRHHYDNDDCSGTFRSFVYEMEMDDGSSGYHVRADGCELLPE